MSEPGVVYTAVTEASLQKQNGGAILLPEQRARLEKMEREMIPLLNSIRHELGKPPVIVPKKK